MIHFDGCPQDWATLAAIWQQVVGTYNWIYAHAFSLVRRVRA